MITGLEQQIVTAYDECSLSVDEITEQFGIEREAVLVVLSRFSAEYNGKVKSGEETNMISEDELATLKGVLMDLATTSECDAVKFSAAKFMFNEGRGRNNPKHLANIGKNVTVNVIQINEMLKQGQSRYLAARERKSNPEGNSAVGNAIANLVRQPQTVDV